ncbi:MAG: prepilin-type N-terminal cleavage/methylation domain-containing protein [Armatimonadota bacterium]|nr:prepilin-type N-terminal cleavage/methylation domain-containing protein [Armatimonadota bacterium]MDR7450398.1 prepilin-type N-terminal cleavage/methylation domain-containing protein [Armatimonadota bacterium]MDR7467019.1 prepilin-type N-terminal cleavage/methylation domain-containing protein [Armatimonadota bacterium]MDR7493439.1 prepilin-type N-terminal cleavage/methylation domain-containing protein [Armatimonadota bacterium]MDR7498704.1 prepilin-type N-terminal cleavage/methylation domain
MNGQKTGTASMASREASAGFTLLEVLVAVAVLALVLVGVGGRGGALDGLRGAQGAIRAARDHTAAASYLQSLQEFIAARSGRVEPGAYCVGPGCGTERALPPGLDGYPLPPATSSQLDWQRLEMVIEPWAWDVTTNRFVPAPSGPDRLRAADALWRVRSALVWRSAGAERSLVLERFVR